MLKKDSKLVDIATYIVIFTKKTTNIANIKKFIYLIERSKSIYNQIDKIIVL